MWWSERKRRRVLEQAEAGQQQEHQAAVDRIISAAHSWDQPTQALPIAPLLTPGQRWRSRRVDD